MSHFVKHSVTALLLAVVALVVLVFLMPAVLGFQRYVITGGSMTGTIDKGSVVYSRLTPVGQLKVGDIITFVPPGYPARITHRIIAITRDQGGQPAFQTKGDYNKFADPWKATFAQPQEARYVFHIPYLGYVLALLSLRPLRMLLIGLPALAIAISLVWSLWTSTGDKARHQTVS